MPSRVWSHICSYATRDERGRVSIIEEFDTIISKTTPVILAHIYVASKWIGANNESYAYRVRMASPDGLVLLASPNERITLRHHDNHVDPLHISIVTLGMVEIPVFGEYPIEFFIDDNLAHVMTLTVSRMPERR